jgi:hypothetical protein
MTLVGGRFEPADLLLGGLEFAREVFLGEAGLFPKRRDLQGHVPRLTRSFKPLRKDGVLQLLFSSQRRAPGQVLVPEGHPTIAQRFNAGLVRLNRHPSRRDG